MSTLDIREQIKEITDIQFDDSLDRIKFEGDLLNFHSSIHNKIISLCDFKDLNDFMAACQKAKKLAGK